MRAPVPALCVILAWGCWAGPTELSRAGFEHDPTVVAGDWVSIYRDGSGQLFETTAEVLPAGGVFLGHFEYFLSGRLWFIPFQDATWDGMRIRFTTRETIDPGHPVEIEWIATFFPASGDRPARLLLTSTLFAVPVEYLRP